MSNKKYGVSDQPLSGTSKDGLGIVKHIAALSKFIQLSETPLVIGIQGAWGTGKTSLLNAIGARLNSDDKDNEITQIWINAWENSLLCSPEQTMLKIIIEIIDGMLEADKDKKRKEEIKGRAVILMKGALRIGAAATMGIGARQVADEFLSTQENSVKRLRKNLEELSEEIKSRPNPTKRFIIYVDDLDRLEPEIAVKVLELLKNIFDVVNCVFVLAIDYQVVVKGLKNKFGEMSENEWEYRAFFDKIIQLPFSMPTGQYNVGNYVNQLFRDIGYTEKEDLDQDLIEKIIKLTIGGNPRSMKRLTNVLSLIQLTRSQPSSSKNDEAEFDEVQTRKVFLFGIVCLQIAYPEIYSVLERTANFTKWGPETAFAVTQGKEDEDKSQFDKDLGNASASGGESFDDPWEKFLYRICYLKPRYRSKAADISKFFNILKDLVDGDDDAIEDNIGMALEETGITSVTASDEQQATTSARQGKYYSLEREEYWLHFLDNANKSGVLSFKKKKKPPTSSFKFDVSLRQIVDLAKYADNSRPDWLKAMKEIALSVTDNGDVVLWFTSTQKGNESAKIQLDFFESLLEFQKELDDKLGNLTWQTKDSARRYVRFRELNAKKRKEEPKEKSASCAEDLVKRIKRFEEAFFPYLNEVIEKSHHKNSSIQD